jgi:hypothetical protein
MSFYNFSSFASQQASRAFSRASINYQLAKNSENNFFPLKDVRIKFVALVHQSSGRPLSQK